VAVVRVLPVVAELIVTVTPLTAAPLGSVTVPRMLPVAVCAMSDALPATTRPIKNNVTAQEFTRVISALLWTPAQTALPRGKAGVAGRFALQNFPDGMRSVEYC
jgi:hypothetical protein